MLYWSIEDLFDEKFFSTYEMLCTYFNQKSMSYEILICQKCIHWNGKTSKSYNYGALNQRLLFEIKGIKIIRTIEQKEIECVNETNRDLRLKRFAHDLLRRVTIHWMFTVSKSRKISATQNHWYVDILDKVAQFWELLLRNLWFREILWEIH